MMSKGRQRRLARAEAEGIRESTRYRRRRWFWLTAFVLAAVALLALAVMTGCAEWFRRPASEGGACSDPTQPPPLVPAWLTGFMFMCLGAGVFLSIMGLAAFGIPIALSSLTMLVVAVTFQHYGWAIALAGAVLVIAVVAVLAWHLWIYRRGLFETVKVAEIAKNRLAKEDRAEIFGGKGMEEEGKVPIATEVEHPTTRELVAKARKPLRVETAQEATV